MKIGCFSFIVIALILIVAGISIFAATLSSMPSLKGEIRPAASSQIFDINGKPITTVHSVENRLPVPMSKIPKNLQNAFLAAEDVRFYQHIGIDPRGILRAVWVNVVGHGVSEGASTITQQLARNALLSHEQSLKRKLKEVILSLQIERQYSKTEIFEMYMNQIYFSQGAYGVQAAAQVYFGKNVEDLNLAECAILAGIPQSPNYFSPATNLKAAKERQGIVLDQMVKYEFIDSQTAEKAKNTEIKVVSISNKSSGTASYFVDYVVQLLIDKYGADAVYRDGLKIYTTLDLDMQASAEKAILQMPTTRTGSNGVKQPQCAIVAIDPHTGYIKAMVGGRGNDQFNRAVLAKRSPGSAFKPFVYLAAIEAGFSSNSILYDTVETFSGNYTPLNYDHTTRGAVTLRECLEKSLNIPTVKLANQVGPEKYLNLAKQMGIETLVLHGAVSDVNLASALGGLTDGVTPLQIASAYGVIANGGVRAEPVAIIKVVDRNGKVLEQYRLKEKSVVNERSTYIMTDIMRGVISRGTGTGANIGRPVAGKTGTTSDYKDAWFVGFTPDLVASVWVGIDTQETLGGISGGGLPATIWRSFMSEALAKTPVRDFVKPAGFVVEPPIEIPKENKDTKDKDKDKDPKDVKDDKNKDDNFNNSDPSKPTPPTKPDKVFTPPPPKPQPNTSH